MKKRKIVYIISEINKAIAYEWISDYINKERISLYFVLLNPSDSPLEQYIKSRGLELHRITFRGKKDWLASALKLFRILRKIKPDAVHCHMFQANIIGLTVAKLANVKKRIYTRHYSSLHHIYFKKGVFWDKYFNYQATHIVAISDIVKKILINWENADPSKVILIPHGFLLEEFENVDQSRIETFKRNAHLNGKSPVIGVISRFTEWKGVQYIIPAFNEILKVYPNAVLVLLNAHGDYEKTILKMLERIPNQSFRTIRFENDIAAAYKSMDVFIHVPIDEHSEAFGQIYIEALAAGTPSVFTLSGIAPDFIINYFNALTVPFKNSEAIAKATLEILDIKELQSKLANNGKASVKENFSINKMIHSLERLYEQ